MKHQFRIFSLLALCLVSGGCPYESNVPIDAPSVKINPNILGDWVERDNENELYHISKEDEFTYKVVITDLLNKEDEMYLTFASEVKGTTFLNILKPRSDDTTPTFLLYKMEVENDNLITLTEVTENIDERFSSSGELRKFVGANMKNSYFYGKEVTSLVRTNK